MNDRGKGGKRKTMRKGEGEDKTGAMETGEAYGKREERRLKAEEEIVT